MAKMFKASSRGLERPVCARAIASPSAGPAMRLAPAQLVDRTAVHEASAPIINGKQIERCDPFRAGPFSAVRNADVHNHSTSVPKAARMGLSLSEPAALQAETPNMLCKASAYSCLHCRA